MYNVRRDSPKHMSPCEIKKLFRNYILIIVILIILNHGFVDEY